MSLISFNLLNDYIFAINHLAKDFNNIVKLKRYSKD